MSPNGAVISKSKLHRHIDFAAAFP